MVVVVGVDTHYYGCHCLLRLHHCTETLDDAVVVVVVAEEEVAWSNGGCYTENEAVVHCCWNNNCQAVVEPETVTVSSKPHNQQQSPME
jgi:hypothetical protein